MFYSVSITVFWSLLCQCRAHVCCGERVCTSDVWKPSVKHVRDPCSACWETWQVAVATEQWLTADLNTNGSREAEGQTTCVTVCPDLRESVCTVSDSTLLLIGYRCWQMFKLQLNSKGADTFDLKEFENVCVFQDIHMRLSVWQTDCLQLCRL